MIEDAELLRRYVAENSEEAFAALVQRRINLVYSVALPRVGGDVHLAEDVTQRVFADLARKAPELIGRVLSGWLFRSAQFAASDIVRAERRRRNREQQTLIMNELNAPAGGPTDWERLRPLLDEALGELSEPDRDAIALRFFEGRSLADVGRALQLAEDTARKRVGRALDKLAAALARRGVTSTAAALGVALADQATFASAPADLAANITSATLAGVDATAIGSAGGAAASVSLLRIFRAAIALLAGVALYQFAQLRTSGVALRDETRSLQELRENVDRVERRLILARRRSQAASEDNARLKSAIDTALLGSVVAKDATRVAFVIDTSGSMHDPKTGKLHAAVLSSIEAVLTADAGLRFFRLIDGDGRYVLPNRPEEWLPNTVAARESAKTALLSYKQDTNSNPVPGVERAIDALDAAHDPLSRLHVFILGDELNGRMDAAVARIDALNPADTQGRRRVSISAVAFPTWRSLAETQTAAAASTDPRDGTATSAAAINRRTSPATAPATYLKFERLMRDVANRHGGTFTVAANVSSP